MMVRLREGSFLFRSKGSRAEVYLPLPGYVRFQKSTFALMSPTGPNPGYGFSVSISPTLWLCGRLAPFTICPITGHT